MTPTTPQTARAADLQLVADLARRAAETTFKPQKGDYPDAAPFVILKNKDGGETVEFLSDMIDPPSRKTGSVTLFDAGSFVTYVKRHQSDGLVVYATPNPAQFLAILNDHRPGGGKLIADHRDFRALLKLDFSDEWKAWSGRNGHEKAFTSTEAFAEFLELNAPDIVDPDPAQFLELALNFSVKSDVTYSKVQRLSDGHVQLTCNQSVEGGGVGKAELIKVPTKFRISVPVFRGRESANHVCEAHFRYRLRGDKIVIWYDLIRPSKVIDEAFQGMWEAIAKDLNVPVLFGEPK